MCDKCVCAVQELFPDLSETEQTGILWNFTAFPFGTAEVIREQLEDFKRRRDNAKNEIRPEPDPEE